MNSFTSLSGAGLVSLSNGLERISFILIGLVLFGGMSFIAWGLVCLHALFEKGYAGESFGRGFLAKGLSKLSVLFLFFWDLAMGGSRVLTLVWLAISGSRGWIGEGMVRLLLFLLRGVLISNFLLTLAKLLLSVEGEGEKALALAEREGWLNCRGGIEVVGI